MFSTLVMVIADISNSTTIRSCQVHLTSISFASNALLEKISSLPYIIQAVDSVFQGSKKHLLKPQQIYNREIQ